MALAAIAAALSSTTPSSAAAYKWHPADWWLADAVCIHHYEGAWNDMGAPYWGGLQFSASFELAYNPWARAYYGHAGRWPIHAQLHAAWRAWQVRGWTPWPNTASWCGLL